MDQWEQCLSYLLKYLRVLRKYLVIAWNILKISLRAVWRQLVTFARLGWCAVRRYGLKRLRKAAQINLGKAMQAHGLGPEDLLERLGDLERRIATLRSAGEPDRALQAEVRALHYQLAEHREKLQKESAPSGVQFAIARLEEIEGCQQSVAQERRELWSKLTLQARAEAANLAIGYGSLAICLAACVLVLTRGWTPSAPTVAPPPVPLADFAEKRNVDWTIRSNVDDRIVEAVGRVVIGCTVESPVTSRTAEAAISSGTCFAVTTDGYLVTNKHVVRALYSKDAQMGIERLRRRNLIVTQRCWVFINGQKYLARVVYRDPTLDLAILKIDRQASPFFALSSRREIKRGTSVWALGFPAIASVPLSDTEVLDDAIRQAVVGTKYIATRVEDVFRPRDFEYVLTEGTVSRTTTDDSGTIWVQHTAFIHYGNSGGPLITKDGLVVGINTLMASESGNVGFALSSASIRRAVLDQVPNAIFEARETEGTPRQHRPDGFTMRP